MRVVAFESNNRNDLFVITKFLTAVHADKQFPFGYYLYQPKKMSSNIASFFSLFTSTAHADAEEKTPIEEASVQEEEEAPEPEDACIFQCSVTKSTLTYL